MIRIDDLIAKVSAYMPPGADLEAINRAYVYSATLHKHHFTPGGVPTLQHALEVSAILAELRLDPRCIIAGLLHEVLEHDLAGAEPLREAVGDEVLSLVEEVSSLETRLRGRGTETEESLAKRLAWAEHELNYSEHYNYQVINDDLEAACVAFSEILHREGERNVEFTHIGKLTESPGSAQETSGSAQPLSTANHEALVQSLSNGVQQSLKIELMDLIQERLNIYLKNSLPSLVEETYRKLTRE